MLKNNKVNKKELITFQFQPPFDLFRTKVLHDSTISIKLKRENIKYKSEINECHFISFDYLIFNETQNHL